MYISIWCLLLAFPRLDINLDLTTTCLLYSNLGVVLVDNSITTINLSPSVCLRHLGENQHRSVYLSLPTSLLECSWHFRRKPVLVEES